MNVRAQVLSLFHGNVKTLGKDIMMSTDVAITSALRNNLNSLQSSQRNADKPQETTSSAGNDIDSSYQIPDHLIAPRSLNEHANALQTTLDGIHSSLKTLEAASESTSRLEALLNEGQSFIGNALDALTQNEDVNFGVLSDHAKALLSEIDSARSNGGYQGTNLLSGDSLETSFSNSARGSVTTTGADLSSAGLGFSGADFSSASDVQDFLAVVTAAQSTVSDFSQSVATDLSLVQTRSDFARETISTLTSGAGDLFVTDQSEEGANLLALRTSQTLRSNDLSLASDTQSSVFKLF